MIEKHVETHDDQLTVGLTPAETDRFYHEHTLRVGAMLLMLRRVGIGTTVLQDGAEVVEHSLLAEDYLVKVY